MALRSRPLGQAPPLHNDLDVDRSIQDVADKDNMRILYAQAVKPQQVATIGPETCRVIKGLYLRSYGQCRVNAKCAPL